MTAETIGLSFNSIARAAVCAALFFLASCGGYYSALLPDTVIETGL